MRTSHLLPFALLLILTLTLAACTGDTADTDLAGQDTTAMQDTAAVGTPTTGMNGAAQLSVVEQEPYGAFIADADGRPLYMFTADTQNESSACYDACAQAWPPLTSTQAQGQQPQAQEQQQAQGQQVQSDMVDSIERRDGSMQVTYNGWPLYYYQQDQGSGQVTGQDVQGFGGEWYLVSPEGEQIEEEGGVM